MFKKALITSLLIYTPTIIAYIIANVVLKTHLIARNVQIQRTITEYINADVIGRKDLEWVYPDKTGQLGNIAYTKTSSENTLNINYAKVSSSMVKTEMFPDLILFVEYSTDSDNPVIKEPKSVNTTRFRPYYLKESGRNRSEIVYTGEEKDVYTYYWSIPERDLPTDVLNELNYLSERQQMLNKLSNPLVQVYAPFIFIYANTLNYSYIYTPIELSSSFIFLFIAMMFTVGFGRGRSKKAQVLLGVFFYFLSATVRWFIIGTYSALLFST